MNNTPQQQGGGGGQNAPPTGEDPSATERRPKPIRGIGYGDIFAVGAKPKLSMTPDITNNPSNVDRVSSNLASSLQKQIPKKPPPPAPASITNDNNVSSADQAPALPPKPSNQFGPHLHHSKPYPPPLATTMAATAANVQQPARREQARVIYAYEPTNDDELALEVGDVIDIIDKEIEDQGWWKGELKGKVGVFPDNFVQLIEIPEPSNSAQGAKNAHSTTATPQDWNSRASTQPSPVIQTIESKFKSVFDSTPKGFSKELESNLVKQNGPASFLSLKRNKLQQQQMATSESTPAENGKKDDTLGSSCLSNTPKLNHMTANRAKGPSRRPPTNLLNKRAQSEPDKPDLNGKDEPPMASLPVAATSLPVTTNHDSLSSLPTGQNNNGAKLSPSLRPTSEIIPHTPITDNHVITPKTSQRLNQQPNLPDKNPKPATTPSWMLELKKAHAEKRRDNPTTPIIAPSNELADTKSTIAEPPVLSTSIATNAVTAPVPVIPQESQVVEEKRPSIQSVRGSYEPSTPTTTVTSAVKNLSSRYSTDSNPAPVPVVQNDSTNEVSAHYESLVKQISSNFQSEINELKDEIKRLQFDFQDFKELKSVVEVMKIELKACQSATESQKRWMKDLVDNLADERKKIAAMQTEIDRNLK